MANNNEVGERFLGEVIAMTAKVIIRTAGKTRRVPVPLAALVVLATLSAGPVAAQRPVPVPIVGPKAMVGKLRVPIAMPAAAPPAGVTVTGTPALARVTWGLVGASSYSVQRWMQSNPECCRASSPPLGANATAWDDPTSLPGTYVYRVSAVYADGRQGFVDVGHVRPEPSNPAVLTATRQWLGPRVTCAMACVTWYPQQVTLDWPKVSGAAFYVLWGPGIPNTGVQLNTTVTNGVETHRTSFAASSQTPAAVPFTLGVNTWSIGAFFLPGPVSTVATSFTKVSLNIPDFSRR